MVEAIIIITIAIAIAMWLILIHFLDVLRLLFRALFSRRRCDIYVFIKRAGEQSKCAALDSRAETQ